MQVVLLLCTDSQRPAHFEGHLTCSQCKCISLFVALLCDIKHNRDVHTQRPRDCAAAAPTLARCVWCLYDSVCLQTPLSCWHFTRPWLMLSRFACICMRVLWACVSLRVSGVVTKTQCTFHGNNGTQHARLSLNYVLMCMCTVCVLWVVTSVGLYIVYRKIQLHCSVECFCIQFAIVAFIRLKCWLLCVGLIWLIYAM